MKFSKRIIITTISILFSGGILAQPSAESDIETEQLEEKVMTALDSLKTSFVRHEKIVEIDNMWIKELMASDLSGETFYIENQDSIENTETEITEVDIEAELPVELLKERLTLLDEKSPFNIEYNLALEKVIKYYLKNRKKSYERLIALSEYYFPLFEEKLAKYHIPLELKYLAIVESALNPRAVSKMGASGLWQFMLATGKLYNLKVNSYIDERYDPIKSTEAACQYLSSLYNMYGDWDLALAAYNAGPGNVNKAIRRSGGLKNYWNIRRNLPRETQGYVPAFIATMYVFEYYKEHNIVPHKIEIKRVETDTIYLKRKMSFQQIADLMDISIEELRFMNPSYKLDIVPYSTEKPNYIRLPIDRIGLFVSNEEKIYAYIDAENQKKEKVTAFSEGVVASSDSSPRFHIIKKGENLSMIARKYGVTVNNLKKWNNLVGTTIQAGKKLRIM